MTPNARAAVVAVVVFLAAGPLIGTATAADAGVAPEDACEGVAETRVVAAFSDGTTLDGDERLYAGTEFSVFVCSGEAAELRETAWTLDGTTDGFETVGAGDYFARVRVTNANGTVSLGDAVPEKDALGPSYTVVEGTGVRTRIDGENRTLSFPSTDAARNYSDAEARFLERADRLSSAESDVDAAAAALGSGEFEPVNASTLDALGTASFGESDDALERAAFAAGIDGDDDAIDVLAALNDRRSERAESSREALERYRDGLRGRLGGARLVVLLYLGGGLIGGVIAGGIGGFALADRELEKVAYDKQLTSRSTYSVRQVAVPAVTGAVLAVSTVVGLALLGWLGAFLEVFA